MARVSLDHRRKEAIVLEGGIEHRIPLTPTEWIIMEALVQADGRPVHPEEFYPRLTNMKAVSFHISRLRRKLGHPELLKARYRWGWYLDNE